MGCRRGPRNIEVKLSGVQPPRGGESVEMVIAITKLVLAIVALIRALAELLRIIMKAYSLL
jgi:hypothetical protein